MKSNYTRKLNLIIKGFIDFIGSLVGLLIISPLWLLIAIGIKTTSKGPILFKQNRLGKDGKVFNIYKFRTMVQGAESMGDGLMVKSEDDSRITKIGKILRRSSLDELPQLLNVIRGQMSLVGPRPPAVYHPYDGYENYPNWARDKFKMKPGITGLSQVTVRNSVSWDERIVLDKEYIDKFNIILDIRILFKTFLKTSKPEDLYLGEDGKIKSP